MEVLYLYQPFNGPGRAIGPLCVFACPDIIFLKKMTY